MKIKSTNELKPGYFVVLKDSHQTNKKILLLEALVEGYTEVRFCQSLPVPLGFLWYNLFFVSGHKGKALFLEIVYISSSVGAWFK